jgi:NADH:ubiquinone oxidoreductase subunit
VLRWLSSILGWWSGSTIGTSFTLWKRGNFVAADEYGNRYFESRDLKDSYGDKKRRWVIYKGYADASKIPPDWHGWMHYVYDEPPSKQPLPRQSWEKPHVPNMSGTPFATYPPGSLNTKAEREKSSADYESWEP